MSQNRKDVEFWNGTNLGGMYESSTKLQAHIKWTGVWGYGIWEEKMEELLVESSREEESPSPPEEGLCCPWRQEGPSAGPL